ncbi:MAG: glutathione S-transferase family protein [Deltaproteobacteria bacterium]|nr:MAG: glutathione S-transferase family protein [Deltaproteobacteria bacterium]
MVTLYDYLPSGNGYKVRLLLSQLGVRFRLVEKDIMKGETRTPDFLAINPNGRIPVLELEDGRRLAESDAILFYLAEGTRFLPEERLARAEVLQWMFFEQYSHEPYIAVARFWTHYLGKAVDAEKTERGYQALDVMERHLGVRQFFVGERYTIADVALYAYTHVAHEGGFNLVAYPNVRAWLGRVASEPGHVAITRRQFG